MLFFVFESLTSTESNPPSHRIQNGTSLSFFFPSVARPSDGKKNTSLMTCSDEAQPVGRHATTNYTKSNLGPSVNLSFFLLSLAQCLLTMLATLFYKRMDTQSISVHHTRRCKRTYLKKKKPNELFLPSQSKRQSSWPNQPTSLVVYHVSSFWGGKREFKRPWIGPIWCTRIPCGRRVHNM